ncbi:MAG: caspase family protein [Pseudomonadota bacterium]|nr:caspase family protein [Pseudomonadota bacterium]
MVKIISPIAVRFLSVLILTFWVGTALADKRVALIVGNGQYTRITPKLVNPANDAHDLAQALASMGFDVILRTDVGKGEFDQALVEFSRRAKNADTALFYYAGHGLQHNGKNYFLPTDIEVQDEFDFNYRAISQDGILYAVGQAKSVKIVVLDACRDNPLARQFIASRSWGGGGLARIDSAEETIIAYATAPDHVANDGEGRNSPFTAALISRIKEPGLEITTMFRRVANDVYARTGGKQQPEITSSLRTDYFLNPAESDSAAWSRVRESTNPADFKEFIQKFPASPFAREAQFRIDLFDRIRRENEEAKKENERLALAAEQRRHEEEAKKEAERLALAAEKQRHEVEAKKEAERLALAAEKQRHEVEAKKAAERLALAAEKQRHEVEAKKEAERLALAAEKNGHEEEAKKESERLQAEKRAAEERAKVAALEEDRKKHDVELEKQRTAEICDRDLAKLKDLTTTLQTVVIQNLAKETACPTIKPAIEHALREVARGVKHACDADRKTLASLKDNDIGSLKTALDHVTCETVRAETQQRLAKLEDEMQRKQSVCADEKTKLDAIDATVAGARQQYVEFSAHAACPSLRVEVNGNIKKIDSRVKEAQTELARLGCYNASINGKFDEASKKSLALYNSKKGSLADSDHLTDDLLSELKQQNLGVCPPNPPAAPIVATPGNGKPPSEAGPPKQKIETGGREEEPVSRPSRRHRIQSAKHEEEPVSRPPRHRTQSAAREEERAPRSRQRAHPSYALDRLVRRAPSMPMSSSATAGSAHNTAIGVGF